LLLASNSPFTTARLEPLADPGADIGVVMKRARGGDLGNARETCAVGSFLADRRRCAGPSSSACVGCGHGFRRMRANHPRQIWQGKRPVSKPSTNSNGDRLYSMFNHLFTKANKLYLYCVV
jgi:hypothetical protein